jgi:AraC-like DNA-binding protein
MSARVQPEARHSGVPATLRRAISDGDYRSHLLSLFDSIIRKKNKCPERVLIHENTKGVLPKHNDFQGPCGTNFSCVLWPRFIFVLRGSYRVVRDLEKRAQDTVVTAGGFYWIRPQGWNLVRNDSARTVLSVIFEADRTRFVWYHHKREAGIGHNPAAHISLRYSTCAKPSAGLRLAVSLMDAAVSSVSNDEKTAISTAGALLVWCRRELLLDSQSFEGAANQISQTQSKFDDIRFYITDHLQQQLSRSQIADEFRISEDHLSRLFRTHANCGFVEYIRNERLRLAERLLAESRLSVKEVAAACGFNLCSYFVKSFRKSHGVTPNEWRRQRHVRLRASGIPH